MPSECHDTSQYGEQRLPRIDNALVAASRPDECLLIEAWGHRDLPCEPS